MRPKKEIVPYSPKSEIYPTGTLKHCLKKQHSYTRKPMDDPMVLSDGKTRLVAVNKASIAEGQGKKYICRLFIVCQFKDCIHYRPHTIKSIIPEYKPKGFQYDGPKARPCTHRADRCWNLGAGGNECIEIE